MMLAAKIFRGVPWIMAIIHEAIPKSVVQQHVSCISLAGRTLSVTKFAPTHPDGLASGVICP